MRLFFIPLTLFVIKTYRFAFSSKKLLINAIPLIFGIHHHHLSFATICSDDVMINNHLLVLMGILVLFGCKESEKGERETIHTPDVVEETNNPDDSNSTTGIDNIDGSDKTDTQAVSYAITDIFHTEAIDRVERQGYRVDDIYLSVTSTGELSLENRTPRTLRHPVVAINGILFYIDLSVEPFQRIVFRKPHTVDLLKSAIFVDEQPLMKVNIKQFEEMETDLYTTPTATHIEQYKLEVLGLKSILNDFDYNVRFIEYINAYGKSTRSRLDVSHQHDESCGWHAPTQALSRTSPHYVKTVDTASPTKKHISLVAVEPSARYRIILHSYNGYATVGAASNGYLSVREHRLYQSGQQAPQTTYLHEKMHNHGFGHEGGMTYGAPGDMRNYVIEGKWDKYYDPSHQATSIQTMVLDYKTVSVNSDEVELHIRFIDKTMGEEALVSMEKLLLTMTDNIELSELGIIDASGHQYPIESTQTYDEGKTRIYDSVFSIAPVSVKQANEENGEYSLYVRIKRPEVIDPNNIDTTIVLMATDAVGQRTQANKIIHITPEMGSPAENGQVVFYSKERVTAEDGYFSAVDHQLYSPEEARSLCQQHGFELGSLQSYKSQEMMDFQMKYLPLKSQVGLSAETGEPVAVSVATSYLANKVEYTDKGALVVCQETL